MQGRPQPDADRRLTAPGKAHGFHTFDDAGHSFSAVERPSYRVLTEESTRALLGALAATLAAAPAPHRRPSPSAALQPGTVQPQPAPRLPAR